MREGAIKTRHLLVCLLACVLPGADGLLPRAQAADLAIVIDDLGHNRQRGERVINLPGKVTLALLPFAPQSVAIADAAGRAGQEVILHQPMEPIEPDDEEDGTLKLGMSTEEIHALLDAATGALPSIKGLSNHTGSRLTSDETAMRALMAYLTNTNLFFLDSRTSPATVAHDMARAWNVPALRRDVFLDHIPTTEHVREQFERALHIARRRGQAVLIAHPHKTTLDFLESRLPMLEADLRLKHLSELLSAPAVALRVHQAAPRQTGGGS